MLKFGRVTTVKVFFLVLVYVFNFDLFKFSAAILEKGLLCAANNCSFFEFLTQEKNLSWKVCKSHNKIFPVSIYLVVD